MKALRNAPVLVLICLMLAAASFASASDTLIAKRDGLIFSLSLLDRAATRQHVSFVLRPLSPADFALFRQRNYINLTDPAHLRALRLYNRCERMTPELLFDEFGRAPFAGGFRTWPLEDSAGKLVVAVLWLRVRNDSEQPIVLDTNGAAVVDSLGQMHPSISADELELLVARRFVGGRLNLPTFRAGLRQWLLARSAIRSALWDGATIYPGQSQEGLLTFDAAAARNAASLTIPYQVVGADGTLRYLLLETLWCQLVD